jgi:hypothetical protein
MTCRFSTHLGVLNDVCKEVGGARFQLSRRFWGGKNFVSLSKMRPERPEVLKRRDALQTSIRPAELLKTVCKHLLTDVKRLADSGLQDNSGHPAERLEQVGGLGLR